MTRQRRPIGIQDFRRLRETGSYYVDKTPLIRQLVEQGDHYFLSRPRRFGKSLLLDTLRSVFACYEPLFRGLDIYPHWDWSAPHPVVRLSFAGSTTSRTRSKGTSSSNWRESRASMILRRPRPPTPARGVSATFTVVFTSAPAFQNLRLIF